jgi:hypothetical protein
LVWALFIIEQSIPLPSFTSPTRDGPKNCQSATSSDGAPVGPLLVTALRR